MTLSWTAIIPVKPVRAGKSRLSAPDAHREALALAFAQDTIAACRPVEQIGRIVLVSDEDSLDEAITARTAATAILRVPDPGRGLNAALRLTAADISPDDPVLALLADLPALTSADLDLFLRIATDRPRTFSPDAAGTGTTALTSCRGRDLDPRFGFRSRAAHRASGAVEITDPMLARLRRDVDTEADLAHAALMGLGTRSASVLAADFR